jgi:Mg-chelatase subunit ChlI
MKNKKHISAKQIVFYCSALLFCNCLTAFAQNPYSLMEQANKLYEKGNYEESIEIYDKISQIDKTAPQPDFNKAVSLQKLGKIPEAIQLYKQLSAEVQQKHLAAKIKYNLGNAFYQKGKKIEQQNPAQAVQHLKDAISNWRKALKMQPDNKNAAKNIELAKLEIQKMEKKIQQQKKQQKKQNNDPNQPQDKSKQNQQNQQNQNQNQKKQKDEQNQNQQQQDQKQNQNPQQKNPQNRQSQKDKKNQQQLTPTARDILQKEKKDKEKRQVIKFGHVPVEKDW